MPGPCPTGTRTTAPKPSTRAEKALATHKPSTKAKQAQGDKRQKDVAKHIGGDVSPDNAPMDVTTKTAGVEVKTMVDNGNDKITMHPESRRRKEAWAKETGKKLYTVVIDDRDTFAGGANKAQYSGKKIYVQEGVGAFRIGSMQSVPSFAALKGIIS